MSIVSISMTWMSANPSKARLARISHPSPPAPITRILDFDLRNSCVYQEVVPQYTLYLEPDSQTVQQLQE